MPEVVNQYSHTFIGQAVDSSWKFYMPNIPKLRNSNYFEICVQQIGMRRSGASAPHDVFFFVGDIQGAKSQIVINTGQIDSRINLGMIVNYDGLTIPALLTSPAPVEFRMNTMQPANPFCVTVCRLAGQELAQSNAAILTAPKSLVPMGTTVTAQFRGSISDGLGGTGTILNVVSMTSPSTVLAIGTAVTSSTSAANTITALGTGTGGTGTYTVGTSQLVISDDFFATVSDTTSNAQLIMVWTIKEMSPYPIPRGEMISY